MSGLAGVLYFDGRSADRADVLARLSYVAHRGPDGLFAECQGPVGLGYARMITTPEAADDTQPVFAAGGRLVTFDGRLDNRDELIAGLRAPAGRPDSELVAAAYERWGRDLPQHLLGDYAVVIWDAPEQRLFVARDEVGFRSLYFRTSADEFTWASEPKPLTAGDRLMPNEGYIAEVLAARITSRTETLYAGVSRLAPAHAMTVSRDGVVNTWRYWHPAIQPFPFRDHREHAEDLRATLRRAVQARLRLQGSATLALSGGLDSGAIAAIIAELRDEGLDSAARISATTMSVPHDSDETARAAATAAYLRLPWQPVDARLSTTPAEALDDVRRMASLPVPPNTRASAPLRELARARGDRAVLYGIGSGEWLDGGYWDAADLVVRGRLVDAARWLAYELRTGDSAPMWGQLWLAAWATVPPGLKAALRAGLGRSPVPWWIEPAFAERVGLAARLRAGEPDESIRSPARRGVLWFADGGDAKALIADLEHLHADAGLELRCPFYDRRVVELLLAMPPEARSAGGRPKAVLRTAMASVLPRPVTVARPDPNGDWIARRAFSQLVEEDGLAALLPVINGWVNAGRLRAMYHACIRDGASMTWPLWAAIAIDFWLRAESTVRAAGARGESR